MLVNFNHTASFFYGSELLPALNMKSEAKLRTERGTQHFVQIKFALYNVISLILYSFFFFPKWTPIGTGLVLYNKLPYCLQN